MKQFICLFLALSILCTPAHGKVVKLGRNINATTSYQASIGLNSENMSAIAKECDPNCLECNTATGICLKCASNRYISGKLCLTCPAKSYCDGKTATPNCSGVSCLGTAIPQATDTGCCCVRK